MSASTELWYCECLDVARLREAFLMDRGANLKISHIASVHDYPIA